MAATPAGGRERIVLAPGCPVQPLGRTRCEWPSRRRGLYVYRNAVGEISTLRAAQHGRLHIVALFVPHVKWLKQLWPDLDSDSAYGWDPDRAAMDLMDTCARQGLLELPLPDNVIRLPSIGRDGVAP